MNRVAPGLSLVLLSLLAGTCAAQTTTPASTEPVRTNPTATEVQGESGPVTVNAGQPAVVPNVADYHVTVADLDTNGDGVISQSEVPSSHALSSEFKLVDRNHDGRINATELASWH